MSAFRWTPRRDADLRECKRDGFTWKDIGRMIGCGREDAIARWALLNRARAAPVEVACVPRPPVPVPTPSRPALIDLSTVPSSMEQRAARWSGNALPVADSREGCSRCGTRGDIGCSHQRAMGSA